MRNPNRADRLQDQVIFFFHFVRHEPVGDSTRNDNVIFGAVALFTENGFNRSAAFEHKNDLVRTAIAVILEITIGLFRSRSIRDHVLVKQNRNPARVEIASTWNAGGLEMMVPERAVSGFLEFVAFSELYVPHARGRPKMMHDREG